MNKLITISILLILFLGDSILYTLGLKHLGMNLSSFYLNITPGFFVIVFIFLISLLQGKLKLKKSEILFLAYAVVYFLVKGFVLHHNLYLAIVFNVFIGPVLLYVILRNIDYPKSKIVNLLIICFFTETFLAIIQRLLGYSFLVMPGLDLIVEASYQSAEFRSVSMYGHYLQGALIVTVFMSFFYIAKTTFTKKFFLLFLGFVAILCYNTRSSMAYWGVMITFLIIQTLFSRDTSRKNRLLCLLYLLGVFIVISYLISIGWGGRLISLSLFDESSAAVRISLFDMFNYISLNDMLWGMDLNNIDLVMRKSEIYIIENYWVIFIFYLGLIPLVFFVIFTVFCLRKIFTRYCLIQAAVPIISFLLISSTNNSMATNIPALFIFVLFAHSITLDNKLQIANK